MNVSYGQARGTGLISVEYTFEGEAAHGAGAPWRGRSALDAVELMSVGWNYKKRTPASIEKISFNYYRWR